MLGHSPTAENTPPDGDGIVHTGSISSTVDLDFKRGEAHKIYHPSGPVRLLYWLAFQAPFPYVANHPALEAARLRRRIVDLLTKYWFGHHLVARVVDVEDVAGGGHDFVTQLVRGHEPTDKRRAKAFLKDLDRRFLDAGIATWQITPYNPHSITNLIEKEDGTYRIIDLESSLVSLVYPLSRLVGFIRAGLVPSFDDIDVDRLDAYVEANAPGLRSLPGDEYEELLDAVAAYRAAQDAWHRSEPRIPGRALSFLLRLVDVPTWLRGARRLMLQGEQLASGQVREGLVQWVDEGRTSREEAEALIASLSTPDVGRAFMHLGAHFAISLPLRFPFGATCRFLYTAGLRLRAEVRGLLRLGDVSAARRLHTVPVALFALFPGFGRLAYLLSPALSSQPLLAAVPLDYVARKLPLSLYSRLHLEALFVYWGHSQTHAAPPGHSVRRLPAAIAARHRALGPHRGLIAVVLAANIACLVIGAVLYLDAGQPPDFWWFSDFGVLPTLNAVQLAAAGVAGIGAYRTFWRHAERPPAEGFGTFFWALGGACLIIFAADEFLGLRGLLADAMGEAGIPPALADFAAEGVTLAYVVAAIALLAVFRDEVLSSRNSAALLIPALALAVIAVAGAEFRAFVESRPVAAVELTAQTMAVSAISLAFVVRYLEVRKSGGAPARDPSLTVAANTGAGDARQ